jgi:hypothetical protein
MPVLVQTNLTFLQTTFFVAAVRTPRFYVDFQNADRQNVEIRIVGMKHVIAKPLPNLT